MATASGQFSGRSQYYLVMDCWEASYSVPNNDSWVQWNLRIDESPNWGSWSNNALTWSVSVHGQGWSGSTTYDFRNYDSLGLGSGGRAVGHNADGTMSIGFSASAGGGTVIGSASCSGSLGLTTIPRASTPTFSSPAYDQLVVGSNAYLVMNRASSSFTHNLDYWFGSIPQTRAVTGAGADANWTVPWAIADQLPNTNTGVGTMRTHTYSGGTLIGYVDQTFRVYVPDNSTTKPTFTGKAVEEANAAVTAVMGTGKYVQGLSRVKGTMTDASAKYSASVSSRRITVAGQNVLLATGNNASSNGTTPNPIATSGTVPVSFVVTDSRGFEYSESLNIDVLPYDVPDIVDIDVVRAASNGSPQEDGTYLRVDLNAVVTSLINSTQRNRLTIKAYTRLRGGSTWTLKSTPVNASSTLSYDSNFSFSGPYDVGESYEVRIEVIDQFATTAWRGTISVAGVFQHWTKDTSASPARSVMGIGKYWEQGTLDVGGDVYSTGDFHGVALLASGEVTENSIALAERYPRAGTTAERDAYWGTPSNDAQRVALANKQVRWFNTDFGYEETYFAVGGTSGLLVPGLASVAPSGWYPTAGRLPHIYLVASGGQTVSGSNQTITAWSAPGSGLSTRHGGAVWFTYSAGHITIVQHGRYKIRYKSRVQSGAGQAWQYLASNQLGILGIANFSLNSAFQNISIEAGPIRIPQGTIRALSDTGTYITNEAGNGIEAMSGELSVEYVGPPLVSD